MTRNPLFTLVPVTLLCASTVLAQEPPAPPSTAPTPPSASTKVIRPRSPRDAHNVQYRVTTDRGPGMHPDLRIAPPGMWWKNPDIVQKITLSQDQQKRMDDIFQQSRLQLIDLKANVEKQEVMLEPMLSANPPDTNKVLGQIDKVASARAELEKANAKMLLGIRGVLSADQWTKLQAEQRANQRFMIFRGPNGPGRFEGHDFDSGPSPKGPGPKTNFRFAPGGPLSLLTLPPLPGSGPEFGSIIGGLSPDGPDLDIQIGSPDDIDF
ncbi:Spy/CpxP family protein refolding chaperone [Edaphobacter albus]|uniref:Spy/CpxP family protein refolding chaperone n=1 Tax=Edaphobacter sp. 4G125 TaxID=2763071 RepID=UPI001645BA72|nr:Spy/CpxP family protein refolding chaperone [Edaphobacter sp. 4G125]QNI37580.1 Spy/CpxP family protein refolding chaperone [Edaphobacter sp. 4G125]